MLPVCLIICQLGRTTEVPSTPTIRRGLHGDDFGGYTRYANSQGIASSLTELYDNTDLSGLPSRILS